MEKAESQILEINLISAQSLKPPSANLRRLQTYALAWIHPSAKLRTRTDHMGSENPTWNDKFIFKVSPDFISGETSAISVEIYAVGCIKDHLIGTVRFLLSSCISSGNGIGTPAFTAVHIRRPSGRFHGVLNIAATVYRGSELSLLNGLSAVCFRDLMKGSGSRRLSRKGSKMSDKRKDKDKLGGWDSGEFSCGSVDFSDGGDSTTSSSSTTSTVLKDWNGERLDMNGENLDGGGLLCGMVQRKMKLCPFDQNLHDNQENRL